MTEELQLLTSIAERVKIIFQKEGIARAKLGRESGLIKSFRYEVTKEDLTLFAAVYTQWVESGRPSVDKKPNIKKVPLDALIKWSEIYQVDPGPGQTRTAMCFAIQNAIYKRGIAPRPFTAAAIEEADKFINPFLDEAVGAKLTQVFEGLAKTQDAPRT